MAAPRAERHRARKMHTTPTSQRRQSRPSRTNCARCVVNYSPRGTREKHMAESSVDPPTPPCLDLLRNRECDERVAENYCKYCKILSDESLILGERFPKYLQVFLFVGTYSSKIHEARLKRGFNTRRERILLSTCVLLRLRRAYDARMTRSVWESCPRALFLELMLLMPKQMRNMPLLTC